MTTIVRRLGKGYAVISAVCLAMVSWLAYHEFVEEPREFAAKGYTDVHKDTAAEISTVLFLAAVPALLGLGWWWVCRALSPLKTLLAAVQKVDEHSLLQPLPRSLKDNEVDRFSAAFSAMAARLDASFRRVHEFTLHASHELKTPLTVMRAQLETLKRENPTLPDGQHDWIESQLDEVQRLSMIVDSLTLLTKADAGLIELERKPVSFHELVQEAAEEAVYLAQPHDVRVALDECDEAVITGDRHRLRQLLLILTDNAVKYNHPGGSVQISLRRSSDTALLRVTNDGDGLSPETQRRLFNRFVRGENAMGKVEGCGLGLSIAQWIVESHGGSIALSPEAGKRVTVQVRLPLAVGAQPAGEKTRIAA
jgi:signal transduction histidine kinase